MIAKTRLALRSLALTCTLALTAGAVAAQPVGRPAGDIAACLCTQQGLTRQSDTIAARRQAFDQQRQALQSLNAEVEAQRPQVNVDDPAAVAAFKQLLERRDAAQQAVDADPGTELSALIATYNQRVADYNRDCTGHDYDATVIANIQKTLSCPAE